MVQGSFGMAKWQTHSPSLGCGDQGRSASCRDCPWEGLGSSSRLARPSLQPQRLTRLTPVAIPPNRRWPSGCFGMGWGTNQGKIPCGSGCESGQLGWPCDSSLPGEGPTKPHTSPTLVSALLDPGRGQLTRGDMEWVSREMATAQGGATRGAGVGRGPCSTGAGTAPWALGPRPAHPPLSAFSPPGQAPLLLPLIIVTASKPRARLAQE